MQKIEIYSTKNNVKLTFRSYFKEIRNNRMRVIGEDKNTIFTEVMLLNGITLIQPTDIEEGDEFFHFENDIKGISESIGAFNELAALIECAKKTRADLLTLAEV